MRHALLMHSELLVRIDSIAHLNRLACVYVLHA